MGRKDFGRKEHKKSKKDAKKLAVAEILPTPVTVELIKTKGKKESPPEEE